MLNKVEVVYTLENGIIDHIDCDERYTIKQLLNKIQNRYKDFNIEEKETKNINPPNLKNIHCVYLKCNKLENKCSLKNYIEDLKYAPLIISNELTKSFENYLYLININNYANFEYINCYSFYYCYKAYDRKSKKEVIIKVLNTKDFPKESIYRAIYTFCDISTINHPGITKILGFSYPLKNKKIDVKYNQRKSQLDLSNYFIFVFEYEKNGTLKPIVSEYLNGNHQGKMNPTNRCKIIYGVAAALKKAHQKNIIRQYLTMSHILIDENFEPKLFEFEYKDLYKVDINKQDLRNDCLYCRAPEIERDGEINLASDVFSYAFFLYKMFSNEIAIYRNGKKILNLIQFRNGIAKGYRPVRPDNIPDHYWELIQRCWVQNPLERPTFDEIVEELMNDKFGLEEFGMKTNFDELHEYQERAQEFEKDLEE